MAVLMPTTSPCRFDQRSAGVARVDRRVGLQEAVRHLGCSSGQVAALAADDAGADGLFQFERIADGHHPVADLAACRSRPSVAAGSVPAPLIRSTARSVCSSVLMSSASNSRPSASWTIDFVGAFDHVVIGQDDARAVDDHARAHALREGSLWHLLSELLEIASFEEVFERRALERVFAPVAAARRRRVAPWSCCRWSPRWAWQLRRRG